jgi:hypothetical protein
VLCLVFSTNDEKFKIRGDKMQQLQKTIYERCLIGITGTAWVAGLLVAGSDSPYMPWLNGIGFIVFLGASILLGKRLDSASSDADPNKIITKFCQKPCKAGEKPAKKHHKINIPYALEA